MNNKEKVFISLLYVSKNLKKNPKKAIKYIQMNRELFNWITDDTITTLMKEHGIVESDLQLLEEEILLDFK
jgi:hypothetical protein